jgi:hypothetical protein
VTLGQSADAPGAHLLQGCRTTRAQPYVVCVNAAVLQYSYEHPHETTTLLDYIAVHGRDGEPAVDLRLLSATAHYVGMELSVLPLTLRQGLGDCGDAFKAACMHGFVMERLDRVSGRGHPLVRTFLSYCQPIQSDGDADNNCLHGVGHELWARTSLGLNATLRLCDLLHTADNRSACWSGVLMEYSEGNPVKGRHGHRPAGRRPLPCGSLAPRFQPACTYAEASYRQYVPGWESPRTTYARCDTAATAYRLRCMMLVSERLLIARADEPQLADATCDALRSGRALCHRSVAELYIARRLARPG